MYIYILKPFRNATFSHYTCTSILKVSIIHPIFFTLPVIAEDNDECEDDLLLPACAASKDSLSSLTLPSSLPSSDISLPTLSSISPLSELGSASRQHVPVDPSSSRLTGTVAVPLFKDTKWIRFTAERSLSFGYPLVQMIPCEHVIT